MRKRRRFGMGALKRKNVAIAAALLTTESDAATESQGSCAQSPSATPRRCAVSLHRRRHTEVSTKHKEAARKSQHCIHSATQSFVTNFSYKKLRFKVAMRGGRKNLKRATEEKHVTLQDGQNIVQVVSLRGSNLIEVMDAHGEKSLALFPAKFQKSMWIKRGSFVVADESGKEKALESGSKVACLVSQVLYYEQVRALQKSPEWPEIFKSGMVDDSIEKITSQQENEMDASDDDGLPPLEANTNRMRPFGSQADEDLESNSDTDD